MEIRTHGKLPDDLLVKLDEADPMLGLPELPVYGLQVLPPAHSPNELLEVPQVDGARALEGLRVCTSWPRDEESEDVGVGAELLREAECRLDILLGLLGGIEHPVREGADSMLTTDAKRLASLLLFRPGLVHPDECLRRARLDPEVHLHAAGSGREGGDLSIDHVHGALAAPDQVQLAPDDLVTDRGSKLLVEDEDVVVDIEPTSA